MRVYLIWDGRDYYGPDPGDKVFDREIIEHIDRPWVFASEEAAEAEIAYRKERYGDSCVGVYVEGYDVATREQVEA